MTFVALLARNSGADDTPTPAPNANGGQGAIGYTLNGQDPNTFYVDGNSPTVDITYSGLAPNDNVYVYPKTNQANIAFDRKAYAAGTADANGSVTVTTCGDGDSALKGSFISSKKTCKTDGHDYFHEGNIYSLGLYDDAEGQAQIEVASFYAYHSYPTVKIEAQPQGTLSTVKVTVAGHRLGDSNENNYQLVLQDAGSAPALEDSGGEKYLAEQCLTIKSGPPTVKSGSQADFQNADTTGGVSKTFNAGSNSPDKSAGSSTAGISDGEYLLKVNAQIHEGGILAGRSDTCQGGFTYLFIPFTLRQGKITLGKAEYDPHGSDSTDVEKLGDSYAAPCAKVTSIPGTSGDLQTCAAVRTAIGNMSVTPEGFVKSLFEFMLMLATFGGLIIIIYSGYIIMMSRGDKEKIAAARETLTSAIVGLLFIVLSIVILEIIGVDILRLPGFSR